MANTDKQNFRCDTETLWKPFREKVERMQTTHPVDMSMILRAEVRRVLEESDEETLRRLGLGVA
jgi:aspartate aminotransferase-like enzyme